MHIHRFSYDYSPPSRGLGPGVLALTQAQRALGHTLEVFTGEWPDHRSVRSNEINVYRLPRTLPHVGPFLTYTPFAAMKWMRAERAPDIVHGHNHHSLHVSLAAGRRRSWRYVLHLHATAAARRCNVTAGVPLATRMLEWRAAELAERLACRVADAVVCVSDSVAAEARRHYGVDDNKLSVVLNGVDLDRFSPQGGDLRAHLGLEDRKVILYVGVLNSRKRLDLLIRSIYWMPDDYVLIAAGSGPSRAELVALIDQLSLGDRVRLMGPVENVDLPPLYRTADLFCLLSASEGLPKVVLEALACGLPVASTRCFQGSSDLERVVTWLEATTPESLAAEIVAMRPARSSIGARECTMQSFTWEAVARRLDEVYARVG